MQTRSSGSPRCSGHLSGMFMIYDTILYGELIQLYHSTFKEDEEWNDQKLLFMSKEVHEEFSIVLLFLVLSLKRRFLRLFFSAARAGSSLNLQPAWSSRCWGPGWPSTDIWSRPQSPFPSADAQMTISAKCNPPNWFSSWHLHSMICRSLKLTPCWRRGSS